MRLRSLVTLALAALLFAGCTKQIRTQSQSKKAVQMGPMVFYSRGGKVVRVEHLTPLQLFNKGAEHYRKGKFKQAEVYYGRIVRYHQRTEYYQAALFNYGLTLEKLQRFQQAVTVYTKVAKIAKDDETRLDARFRLGASLSKAKRWREAEKLYRELLHLNRLKISERLEVMARLGVSVHEQKRLIEAQDLFRQTIRIYHRASRKEYLGNDYFTSLAHFRLGMIYDRKFRERKFRAKQAQMKADLNAKATHLLTAQAHYMRTIRLRNPEWVVAALFRVGDMYHKMYHDMLNAPVPKDLTKDEIALYKKMLKKKIRILLTKANYAFERNVHAAQALGLQHNQWIEKTRKRMQDIRNRIIKDYYTEPADDKSNATSKPAPRKAAASTSKPALRRAASARPAPRRAATTTQATSTQTAPAKAATR